MTNGTPKTLTKAIQNGLIEAATGRPDIMGLTQEDLEVITVKVRAAVVDYLAQHAGVFMLSVDPQGAATFAKTFWEKVKGSSKA